MKPIRIWYQSYVDKENGAVYWARLREHLASIVDPGTTVDIKGITPHDSYAHPIVEFRCAREVICNAVRAEREGYDAFIVGTYIEPYLRELRAAVDIPVVSSLEATLLVGCSTAHTIGLVTLNRSLLWSLKISLERHRLGARVGAMLVMEPEMNERSSSSIRASPNVRRSIASARSPRIRLVRGTV